LLRFARNGEFGESVFRELDTGPGVGASNAHVPVSKKFLRRFFQKAAAFYRFQKPHIFSIRAIEDCVVLP
jgi:hypothetical protein